MSAPESSHRESGYVRAFKGNDASLALFLAAMHDFDSAFCDAMASGTDFTLRLEIHGDRGEMIHARVQDDQFRRPAGVERRLENSRQKL